MAATHLVPNPFDPQTSGPPLPVPLDEFGPQGQMVPQNLYPKLVHPVHGKNKISQGTPPCWNVERGLPQSVHIVKPPLFQNFKMQNKRHKNCSIGHLSMKISLAILFQWSCKMDQGPGFWFLQGRLQRRFTTMGNTANTYKHVRQAVAKANPWNKQTWCNLPLYPNLTLT